VGEWFFRKKGRNEVERDPGWDEYFTSNRSTDESLVREAIQNSLDAHAKVDDIFAKSQPAEVRFYYSGESKALPRAEYEKYLRTASVHYVSEDCKVGAIPEGNCPFVTIEDFNTTGLTGHPDWDYTNIRKKPPYYRFFWSENQSEKGEGTRGKWGIGKVVFPIASRLRSFFAYSIRDKEEPREILCGKALLSFHTVDGVRYSPDGWFGLQTGGDGVPETDASAIRAFKDDFNLKRVDQPGLSVVVPFVKALNWDELKRVLIENYMVSFIQGDLRVELENGDGEHVIYDSAHLTDIELFLVALSNRDPSARILYEAFKMVCEALTTPVSFRLESYEGECPDWQDRMFKPETLSAIRNELDRTEDDGLGKPVTIVVPMRIAYKETRDKLGEFKVVIRRSTATSARPLFYRQGLFINRVKPHSIANFISVVLIDGAVSDMLNQAEPPSHSEWRINTGEFLSLFKYPGQHLEFVTRAVRRIVDRIDETEKGLDYSTLKNIFFVSREKALAPLRRGKGAGKGDGTGGAKDPPPTQGGATGEKEQPDFSAFEEKPKPYSVYPVQEGGSSGIVIKVNEKAFKPFDLKVSFFYETLSGKVKFDENDFSFLRKDSLSVTLEPAELDVEYPAANRLRMHVTEATKNFKVTIRGFDSNRDLRVLPHMEEYKESMTDGTEL